MPYSYLDNIAIADVAFRAWGDSLEEMFIAASDATMNVMVEELGSIENKVSRKIGVAAEEMDMLLFNLLQEIIFYKDAEQLLLRVEELRISEDDGLRRLMALAGGEKIDTQKHVMRVDVKAVSLHRFSVKRKGGGWEAMVILDV